MNSASAVVVFALIASTWGKPQPQRGFGGERSGRRLFEDIPPHAFNGGPPTPNDFVGGFDDEVDFNQGFGRDTVLNQEFNEPIPFSSVPQDNFDLGSLETRQQKFNGNQQGNFGQVFPNQPDPVGFNDRKQGFSRNPGSSHSDFDINQKDAFDNTGFGTEQDFIHQRRDFINDRDAIISGPSELRNQQVPFGQGEQNFGSPREIFVPTSQTNRVQQTDRVQQTNRIQQPNRVQQTERVPQSNIISESTRIPQGNRHQLRNRNPQTNINQPEIFARDKENFGLKQERFGSQQNIRREHLQRIPSQQRNIRTGQGFGNQQEITGRGQQRFAIVSANITNGQQKLRNQHEITRPNQQEFPENQDFIDDVRFNGFQQNNIRPQQAALTRGHEGATLINGGIQNQNIRQPEVNNFQPVPEEDLQNFPDQQTFLGPQSGIGSQQGFSGNQHGFSSSRAGPGASQQSTDKQQKTNRGQGRPGREEQSGKDGIRTRQNNFNGQQGFSEESVITQQQQNPARRQELKGNERRNNNRRLSDFNNQPNSIGTNSQNFNEQRRLSADQQGISNRQQQLNRQQSIPLQEQSGFNSGSILNRQQSNPPQEQSGFNSGSSLNRQQSTPPQGQSGFNSGSSLNRPQEEFQRGPIRPIATQPRNNVARQDTFGTRQPISNNKQVANNNRIPISLPGNSQQSFDNRQQGFGGSQQGSNRQRGFEGSQQGTVGSQQSFSTQQNFFN